MTDLRDVHEVQPDVQDMRTNDEEGTPGQARLAVRTVLGDIFTEGNHVEVLRNGEQIFPAMLEAVENAETSIDFVTFVYWGGEISATFAQALADRARNRVRVRVVLDGYGSIPMKQDWIDEMESAGVIVERFRPVMRWKFWETDHRTHRKILVCDDRVAFTGGVGIADEWRGDARNPDEWRETHFRIEGPAVLGLRAAFLTDWRDTGHRIDRTDIDVTVPRPAGDMEVAVVDGSAQIGVNDAERLLEALVAAAERRIVIQTPYFNPTDELVEALREAQHRGVEIDILLPGPNIDKQISFVMAKYRYHPLVEDGIRVWIYQPTMMHVKAMVVDDEIAVVGSVNFNRRSVEKDEEVALVVNDRRVVATLLEHFEEDREASVPACDEGPPTITERALARLVWPIRREL